MDDDKRVGELDERSLELLREIVREGAETSQYPEEAVIRARYAKEPWIVDDLFRLAIVSRFSAWLVPTIDGLRIANTPVAQSDLTQAKDIFEELRKLYKKQPRDGHKADDISKSLGLPLETVGRLLFVLYASNSAMVTGVYPAQNKPYLCQIVSLSPSVLLNDPFESQTTGESLPDDSTFIHLIVRDFMGLAHVDWSPEGVCLVIGPNGSGKSTLLQSLAFLRDFLYGGMSDAIKLHRGASGLKRIGADPKEDIFLAFGLGNVIWELRLPVGERIRSEFPGEIVKVGDTVFLRRGTNQADWYLGPEKRTTGGPHLRSCLLSAWDAQSTPALEPMIRIMSSFRLYHGYKLDDIRNGGKGSELDHSLDENGQNLFVVLRNWKTAPREFDDQFAWVLHHLRNAFRGMIVDIEFGAPMGEMIPTKFYPPDSKTGLPMSRAAEGLLVGLLHLTAVAGAQQGSILAIEEMENFLHPHAIRCILAAMREMAERRNLTILLSTHSPLLMNAFRKQPEQVYVMEPGQSPLPIALDKLHDPEWLAHFELGDLYDRQEFGAPRRPQDG